MAGAAGSSAVVTLSIDGKSVRAREGELLLQAAREGGRQAAGGVVVAKQHVSDGVAGLLAGIPDLQQSGDLHPVRIVFLKTAVLGKGNSNSGYAA